MARAGAVLVLATLAWPQDATAARAGNVEPPRPYGRLRRRRVHGAAPAPPSCFATPFSSRTAVERAGAPWGVRGGSHSCAPSSARQRGGASVLPHARWVPRGAEGGQAGTAARSTGDAPTEEMERPPVHTVGSNGGREGEEMGGLALPLGMGRPSRITSVKVDNLAMVDSVLIELGRGLIAVTGETGAGKSLISSAFSLAAGARVRGADLVGNKGSTAAVQLQLELEGEHRASTAEVLERFGVPLVDDGRRLSVIRTVGGKSSSASVNGCSVKVGALREVMSPLIYTVDANAFELFSRADGRLRTLDRMLAPEEILLADKVRRVVVQLKQAEACRARLEQRCRFEGGEGLGGDGDDTPLLHHWVEELDQFREGEMAFMDKMRSVVDSFVDDWGEDMLGPLAEPFLSGSGRPGEEDGNGSEEGPSRGVDYGGPGEVTAAGEGEGLSDLWPRLSRIHEGMEDLEASRTKVELARQLAVERSNPESIAHALDKIRDLLIDAEDENVGLSQELLEETHEDLNSLEDLVKRAGEKLERSVGSLPVLPITLEEVEERIVKWRDLSRKHGVSPERLGSMQSQLRVELDELVVAAEALPLAREEEERWRLAAEEAAGELSAARRRAAVGVEELVNPMMADVGLEGATFKVLVEESKTLGPTGADRVQFLLEANRGQTRGTVDAVASSGEKSRLLLLLETRLPPPQARSNARLGGGAGVTNGEAEVEEALLRNDAADEMRYFSDQMVLGNAAGESAVGRDGGLGGGRGRATGVVERAPPCAVLYDEIDAHVGGRTAVAVGRLLANQGRDSQVLVVTHTASVAALADQHLVVDKTAADCGDANGNGLAHETGTDASPPWALPESADDLSPVARRSRRFGVASRGGMSVSIREVKGLEREQEVARMAAGDMGGGAAAELAREMLRYSRRQGS
ncbi:unnamed protein product [Scytosiphon promiscuus]